MRETTNMSESLTVTDESVETLAEVLDDQLTMAVANGTPTHFIADHAGEIARGALTVLAGFGWYLVRDIDAEEPQRDSSESPRSVDVLTDVAAAALRKGQSNGPE